MTAPQHGRGARKQDARSRRWVGRLEGPNSGIIVSMTGFERPGDDVRPARDNLARGANGSVEGGSRTTWDLVVIASNLHRGGGVQVAASLIEELAAIPGLKASKVHFELSSEVMANVRTGALDGYSCEVFDRRVASLTRWPKDVLRRSRATLVVFGPPWFPVMGARRVMGYADVTAILPTPEGLSTQSPWRRARHLLSRVRVRGFDQIVVETQAFADAVVEAIPALRGRVEVVANCVSSQVLEGSEPVRIPTCEPGVRRLVYTTASYAHKNLAFLPHLARALALRGVPVRFLLTLSDAEWDAQSDELKACSDNVGSVGLNQIKALHAASDGAIFPSLMEASSAAPLEAMALGTPLYASDRPFVRTSAGAAALYFDPHDPDSAAAMLAEDWSQPDRARDRVAVGRARVARLPTPAQRAARFAQLCGMDAPRAGARLLIVNNGPVFYRTPAYAAVVREFNRRTGGSVLVAYQSRRGGDRRAEWFYTPDEEIPYDHVFLEQDYRYIAGRRMPPPPGISLLATYRPTHLFTAGWDTPLSLVTSAYARLRRAPLAVWVESSPLTSTRNGPLINGIRREFLTPATVAVVPTSASEQWVSQLAGRPVPSVRLLNPVDLKRLPEEPAAAQSRIVFLGDLSMRKGFDRFAAAAGELREVGFEAHAWGRDTEDLAAAAPHVHWHGETALSGIIPLLSADDVLVIPSRVDPAPLTYSEALALGLRVVVSDTIAYREHAASTTGTEVVDASDPRAITMAVQALSRGPRPAPQESVAVGTDFFARQLVRALVE